MKFTKAMVCALAGVMAATVIAGCGGDQQQAQKKDESKKPIRIATNATFVPFEFKDSDSSSEYKGFEMDLFRAVAKEMGRDIEYNNIPFSGIIPIIQQGDMDIAVSGMTMTKERAEKVLFAAPFYESKLVILTPKDSGIKTVEDLQGKVVAVQMGTTGSDYAQNHGLQMKQFDHNAEAIMELQVGGSPAAIVDKPVADYFVANDGKDKFAVYPIPDTKPEYLAFAMNKDNKELQKQVNDAMKKVIDSGEYQKIYTKWFNSEAPKLPASAEEAFAKE